MQPLKLLALDADDLAIVAAQLQDAVMRLADVGFFPKERRFAMVLNRFDWPAALEGEAGTGAAAAKPANERRRAAIRFEHVRKVQRQNVPQDKPDTVLALLTIGFTPSSEAPSGTIELVFAGGAAIRLEVDYIEAELRDLGGAWAAAMRPDHDSDPAKAP